MKMAKSVTLRLNCIGGKLLLNRFAGQVTITPLVAKIGDTMALSDDQVNILIIYLEELCSAT